MFRFGWSVLGGLAVSVLAACAGEGEELAGETGDAISKDGSALDDSYGTKGKAIASVVPRRFTFAAGAFVVEQAPSNDERTISIVKVVPGAALDKRFATRGQIAIANREGEWSVEVQSLSPRAPNGFYVALGMTRKSPNDFRGRIIAYRADGSVDASFASGGMLELESRPRIEAIDARGRLLVTLHDSAEEKTVRFDATGTVDRSFSSIVKPAVGDTALALDSKGRILFNSPEGLSRYLDSGKLDVSFGTNGSAFTGGYDRAKRTVRAILVPGRPDLRVSLPVAGDDIGGVYIAASKGQSGGVVHLAPNGKLDLSFGNKGFVKLQTDASDDVHCLTLDKKGRLLVGYRHSQSGFGLNIDFGVARLTLGGNLDKSFDGDGIATVGFGSAFSDEVLRVFEDAEGRFSPRGQVRPMTPMSVAGW